MTDAQANLPSLADGLRWKRLGPQDLGRVEELHRLSVTGLPPRIVKPETHAFLASMLSGRGEALGIENDAGELIAYGFLQHDLLPEDDVRSPLGLPASMPLAKLAGAAVAPNHRGRGLQRALIRARASLASPRHVLFATASPFNAPSWASLLTEQFPIRRLEYRYGGHPRFIHVREPGGVPPLRENDWQDVAGNDVPTHERLLAEGCMGLAAAAQDRIRYHRRVAS